MPRLFDFIIGEPEDKTNGKGWIDPQTGQAYLRVDGKWIPFAGGPSATFREITLFIKGIEKTRMLKAKSLLIKDELTSKADTCSFILDDTEGSNKPSQGDEVIIYKGTPPVKIFAGEIIKAPQSQISPGVYSYAVRCVDYSRQLDKKKVVETYTGQTCSYIINDIIDNYAPGFSTINVQTGPVITFIAFNYKSARECIRDIARLSGYDWYVDYDGDIHFFARETNTAPYILDETVSSGRYVGLTIAVDKSQLRNRVYVRGGYYLSSLYTQEIVADGEQLEFLLAYESQAPISVYVDDVAHTLGIDNIDTTGVDFVVNVAEKTIKNLDHAKLTDGQVFKITYKYKIPILCMVDDEDSQEAIKLIEGGDGIYEGPIIVDESIESLDAARERALAEIRQYSNAPVQGSFKTDQDGYRSGQLLPIDISSRNINSQYLIQSVTKKSIGGGHLEYEVAFATMLTGLTDFLLSLWEAGRKIITREDEILDELVQKSDEISVSHAAPTFEEQTPPYQYGPGGSPQGVYNESQYG